MLNLAAGGSVYVQEDFDMDEVVRILDEEGVNRTMLVPAMIQALLVFVPDIADRGFDDLEQIGYGASPIAPDVLRRAIEVFGCEFTQGYGCTESCGGITLLGPERPSTGARGSSRPAVVGGSTGPRHRGACRGRDRSGRPARRDRRDPRPRPPADDRVLAVARGHGRRPAGRLAAHRRRRAPSTRTATSTSRTG